MYLNDRKLHLEGEVINMRSKVFKRVKEFIMENNEWVKEEDILLDSNLIDLGVDSIQMMMLLVCVENEFSVVVEDNILEKNTFENVNSFVTYIEGLIDDSNLD